jgi:hypothetical protein
VHAVKTLSFPLALALALAGCGEDTEPPPRYPFTFTAHADGDPLTAVQVLVNEAPVGTTNAEGVLRVDLTGPPGSAVRVQAVCPAGHRSAQEAQVHTLRRVAALDPATASRGIEVTFGCPPEHRTGVVVVRTHEQPGIPVMLDGREVARTDESGAAHVRVAMAPGTTFQVMLDTRHNALLRPSSPNQSFTLPDHDEVFVLDQHFEVEEPPRVRRPRPRAAPAGPRLPVRIPSRF